ncbi:unnamed protein product [Albugo candida]|uniref:PH domain-containing protein n=1 Tax=Albugo candida TaxID=65357 RepID=A0A024GAY9_9STRA|nr:unnamed protein product [Albugo candida]|eukprot:CCI43715.1 unnamed protein product [Albugo candida]
MELNQSSSRDLRSASAPTTRHARLLTSLLRSRYPSSTHSLDSNQSPSSSPKTSSSSFSWPTLSLDEERFRLQPVTVSKVEFQDQFHGWLWMRGSRLGRWRHRFFVLNGSMLTSYETFPSEKVLRQALPEAFPDSQPRNVLRVAHVEEGRCRIGFKIYGTCGKILDVRAPSTEARNAWLRGLKPSCRRKSLSWSMGNSEDASWSLSTFNADGVLDPDRLSIPVTKSGWIEKQSAVLKRWNRYFFVIQGNTLSYYANDKPYQVPRCRVYIDRVIVPREACTLLLCIGNQQRICLRFSDTQELDEWRDLMIDCSSKRELTLSESED